MHLSKAFIVAGLAGGLVLASQAASAATLTTLHIFTGVPNDGSSPLGQLADVRGILYGSTFSGGPAGLGTVFSIDPVTKAEAVVHSFSGSSTDGSLPENGPIAFNNIVYGTTFEGGPGGQGTVFSVDPATGVYRVLHLFGSGRDGAQPSGLIVTGNLIYGVTFSGGTRGVGTIYSIDPPTGHETVVYNFTQGGLSPASIVYGDGKFYGVLAFNPGALYRFDLSTGKLAIIYNFPYGTHLIPGDGLVYQAGNLYGVEDALRGDKTGSIYKFTIGTGVLSTLYTFAGGKSGKSPDSRDPLSYYNGSVYGGTSRGGTKRHGVFFKVDVATGAETVLYKFQGGNGGATPGSGAVEIGGAFYGTTAAGGMVSCDANRNPCGTVFKLVP